MLKFEVKMCVVGNIVFVVYFKSGTSEILLEKAFRLFGRSAFTFIHSFPSSSLCCFLLSFKIISLIHLGILGGRHNKDNKRKLFQYFANSAA